jgi:hypothetical protein
MPEPIVVPRISLEAVTGDTVYPGENGFFSAYARLHANEHDLVEQLSLAYDSGSPVVLKCGYIVVSGVLTRRDPEGTSATFILSVDEVAGRKPNAGDGKP